MDILNKSVVTSKKNVVKLILYFITLVILGLLIYYAFVSYKKYKNSSFVYDTAETLLINDWVVGTNATIEPTTELPQSMIANEYSFTCLIYLNDLKTTDKHTHQILLSRGDDLRVEIPKLIDNPLNNLKFHFKLQSEIVDDDHGGDEKVDEDEEGDEEEEGVVSSAVAPESPPFPAVRSFASPKRVLADPPNGDRSDDGDDEKDEKQEEDIDDTAEDIGHISDDSSGSSGSSNESSSTEANSSVDE